MPGSLRRGVALVLCLAEGGVAGRGGHELRALRQLRGGMPDLFPWERPYKSNAERWAEAGVSLQVQRRAAAAGRHARADERVHADGR